MHMFSGNFLFTPVTSHGLHHAPWVVGGACRLVAFDDGVLVMSRTDLSTEGLMELLVRGFDQPLFPKKSSTCSVLQAIVATIDPTIQPRKASEL